MRVPAWHSRLRNEPYVYHFDDCCTVGDNVQPENRLYGMDDRRACDECTRLQSRLGASSAAQAYADKDPLDTLAARRLGEGLTAREYYATGDDPLADIAANSPRRLGK